MLQQTPYIMHVVDRSHERLRAPSSRDPMGLEVGFQQTQAWCDGPNGNPLTDLRGSRMIQ